MLVIFQLVFTLFGLLALWFVVVFYRKQIMSRRGLLFWILVWILALVAVIYPQITQVFASYFGIGRGTDLVVYVTLAAMFFMVFRLHVKIELMSRQITKVVRKDALDDADK